MLTVNPDTHPKGKYSPANRVTAVYDTSNDLEAILQSLRQNGFVDTDIDIFIGEDGAEKLDLHGKQLGPVVRFLRDLEVALADETELHKFLDEILRKGGMTINVLASDSDEKKHRAVKILKAHAPRDLRYWGHLSIEQF